MSTRINAPALIVHGGAGGRSSAEDRPLRRRAMIAAAEAGAKILRDRGAALDAVSAAVALLEDDPLFNAGFGSVLTTEGKVEMDAAVATARRTTAHPAGSEVRTGGVVLVSRVRNPIRLARAVMDLTPHVLLAGAGAEHLARHARIPLCRPETLVSQRARARWMALKQSRGAEQLRPRDQHGTVGAAALDVHGGLAAATSTGGVAGKLPGRIGDSAIFGAGLCVDAEGAASATGMGEAIMRVALCRDALQRLSRKSPAEAAPLAIAHLHRITTGEAGIILVDRRGRLGYAHNALAMEIATFSQTDGIHHHFAPSIDLAKGAAL